jgi:hypothetical protein
MAADPTNGLVLEAIDVFIGTMDATVPEDIATAMGSDWDQAGLIDPEDGVEHTREWGKDDDFYGMGPSGIVLVTSVKGQFKTTETFQFIEDNAATRKILWPGSTETELVVPTIKPVKFAQHRFYQNGVEERLITSNYALISVDGFTFNQDLTKFPATATIVPTGDGKLWVRQLKAVAP